MRKLTIKEMREIVKAKGGKCLSKVYVGNHSKLKWRCKAGHEWSACPCNIKTGTWCRKCATIKQKLKLEYMQKLARNRGGECLSKEYKNNRTKLKWKCKYNHTWDSIARVIQKGHWCPFCAGLAKGTIQQMKSLALLRHGKCLSKKYDGTNSKLKWQCKQGHTWLATPHKIKSGQWCPVCSLGIGERVCRRIFEILFDAEFQKSKPSWLVSTEGERLELDGYNQKFGIAFEYQGIQHYESIARWFRNRTLSKQKRLDRLKRRLCKSHKVILVSVPYTVTFDKMADYIIEECDKKGLRVRKVADINKKIIDAYSPEKIKEMQEIAKLHKGKLLSKQFINVETKLHWFCKDGHDWWATPAHIKHGEWCRNCSFKTTANKQRDTIQNMQKIAEERGGKCLSKKYTNAHVKLKWECKREHTWYAIPNSVTRGCWCMICGGKKKLTIGEMRKLAKMHHGRCLSKKYYDASTKLHWFCKDGHDWWTTPNQIKNMGQWCPTCSRKDAGIKRRKASE